MLQLLFFQCHLVLSMPHMYCRNSNGCVYRLVEIETLTQKVHGLTYRLYIYRLVNQVSSTGHWRITAHVYWFSFCSSQVSFRGWFFLAASLELPTFFVWWTSFIWDCSIPRWFVVFFTFLLCLVGLLLLVSFSTCFFRSFFSLQLMHRFVESLNDVRSIPMLDLSFGKGFFNFFLYFTDSQEVSWWHPERVSSLYQKSWTLRNWWLLIPSKRSQEMSVLI